MDNELYILNSINKGIKMGMDSISTIAEKAPPEDPSLRRFSFLAYP